MSYFREGIKAGLKAPDDCDPVKEVNRLSETMHMNYNQFYEFHAGFTYGIAGQSNPKAIPYYHRKMLERENATKAHQSATDTRVRHKAGR